MGDFWLIRGSQDVDICLDNIRTYLKQNGVNRPLKVQLKPYTEQRSLSQNALFHNWVRELVDYFCENDYPITFVQMKKILKNRFLGTEDIVIHNTIIKNQLRETSSLDVGEFQKFLEEVQSWSYEMGAELSNPEDSQFQKNRRFSEG